MGIFHYKIVFSLLASVLVGCATTTSTIASFDGCVENSGIILKTMPPRCVAPNGETFVSDTVRAQMESPTICIDSCGNGVCDEIVCQGSNCPCPESIQTCPKDCK